MTPVGQPAEGQVLFHVMSLTFTWIVDVNLLERGHATAAAASHFLRGKGRHGIVNFIFSEVLQFVFYLLLRQIVQ